MTARFTLISELGRGGMGVVWKARDNESGEIVALKLLHRVFVDDPDYVARFEREVEIARRINSPNVVRTLGYGTQDGAPYMAMEFIEGRSLRDRLAESGPRPWREVRPVIRQIAEGLAAAHRAGVIHRDLKPSNVMMAKDGTAKLADFGIARALDMTRLTGGATVLGTPHYMAPDSEATTASDLYALGCIAFEMLTGQPPFTGETPQAVMVRHIRESPTLTSLPPEAKPLVDALLNKDRAQRPRSARAVARALADRKGEETKVPSRRHPWHALAAVLSLAAILTGIAIGGIFVVLVLNAGSRAAAAEPPTTAEIEQHVFDQINEARAAAGVSPLIRDMKLDELESIVVDDEMPTDCTTGLDSYFSRAGTLPNVYAKAWAISIYQCTSDTSGSDVRKVLVDNPSPAILKPDLSLVGVHAAYEPPAPHMAPRAVISLEAIVPAAPTWTAEPNAIAFQDSQGDLTEAISKVEFLGGGRVRINAIVRARTIFTSFAYDRKGGTKLTGPDGTVYLPLDWSTSGNGYSDPPSASGYVIPGIDRTVWVDFVVPLTDGASFTFTDGQFTFPEITAHADTVVSVSPTTLAPSVTKVEIESTPPGGLFNTLVTFTDPEGDATSADIRIVDASGQMGALTVPITTLPGDQRSGYGQFFFPGRCSAPATPTTVRIQLTDSLGHIGPVKDVPELC